MEVILHLLISSLVVFITAYILPGVHLENFLTAIIVAVVLGAINAFLRPILFLLTLPINILTLGLFTFVIMALCVLLVSAIVPGFTVDGFWWAMAFALVFSILNSFIYSIKS